MALLLGVEFGVRSVGDEHVAGRVEDRQRRLGLDGDRLWRHAACPEHRHLASRDLTGRRSRAAQIGDAEGGGSPIWTGAPCIAGKREEMSTGAMSSGANGLIDTTIGPERACADAPRSVMYIGTLTPCADAPAAAGSGSAHSNVNEQPSRKLTRSSRQYRVTSVGSSTSEPFSQTR